MYVYSIFETGSTPAQSFYVVKADSYKEKTCEEKKNETNETNETNDSNICRRTEELFSNEEQPHPVFFFFSFFFSLVSDEIQDEDKNITVFIPWSLVRCSSFSRVPFVSLSMCMQQCILD